MSLKITAEAIFDSSVGGPTQEWRTESGQNK